MKYTHSNMTWLNLPNMPAPVKALFSGYLLVVGVGLFMAGLQIMLTHGMADGKIGLSKNDIVYSYYGDPSGSKLASKLNGSMKDKAPLEVREGETSVHGQQLGRTESLHPPRNTRPPERAQHLVSRAEDDPPHKGHIWQIIPEEDPNS